jgi:hypothetical protein
MRGRGGEATSSRLPVVERHRLSDEEEAWIARQLAEAPSLAEPTRRRIEQLLALPPDGVDVVGVEVRAS